MRTSVTLFVPFGFFVLLSMYRHTVFAQNSGEHTIHLPIIINNQLPEQPIAPSGDCTTSFDVENTPPAGIDMAALPDMPAVSRSYYIYSADLDHMEQLGEQYANEVRCEFAWDNPQITLLTFGFPSSDLIGSNNIGVRTYQTQFNPITNQVINVFIDMEQVGDATLAFIKGYSNVQAYSSQIGYFLPDLVVGVGLTNSPSSYHVMGERHGLEWAQQINRITGCLNDSGLCSSFSGLLDDIIVVGAIDFETGFNEGHLAVNWVNGYRSVSSYAGNNQNELFFYGAIPGCPSIFLEENDVSRNVASPEQSPDDILCRANNESGNTYTWKYSQIATITSQIRIRIIPQIYNENPGNSTNWSVFARYTQSRSELRRPIFRGILTQNSACRSDGSRNQNCIDIGMDNTPAQGWGYFLDEFLSYTDTQYVEPFLDFLSDIDHAEIGEQNVEN